MAGKSTISITFELDGDSKGFKELAASADGLRRVLQSAAVPAEDLRRSLINWSQGVQAIDAVMGTVGAVSSALSRFSDRMRDLQSENMRITQLTGETGDGMLRLRSSVQAVSEHFGKDFNGTLQAANALSKGFGISMEDAMGLVRDGLVSGADANGEFIDTLKEYPRYFKEAGLSAEEFVAATAYAARQGIYSDKGADVIKEGNLRIREMTKATADALDGIGISAEKVQEDLRAGSITTFDVMRMVSAELGGLPASSAAVGAAIADIFGGPGEDAGLEYIKTLATVQLSMDAVKAAAGETAAQQERQIQAQESLKNGLSRLTDLSAVYTDVRPYVDLTAQIGMAAMGVGGLVNTVKAMNIQQALLAARTLAVAAAQKAASAAAAAWAAVQKALNMALAANPVGLLVAAVGALVAGVIYAYKNCETFRDIVSSVWEAVRPLADAVMNGLAKAFGWLAEKCREAWGWLKSILGLGGRKVKVDVEVSRPEKTPAADTGGYPDISRYGRIPAAAGAGKTGSGAPVWKEDARTLKEITDNVRVLEDRLQKASAGEAAMINRQIAMWERKADAIRNAGKAAGDAPVNGGARTLREITDNVRILEDRLQEASAEEAVMINRQIAMWERKADAIRNAGMTDGPMPEGAGKPDTIEGLTEAVRHYRSVQQGQSAEEAVATQRTIDLLEAKRDAMQRLLELPSVEADTERLRELEPEKLRMELELIGIDGVRDRLKALRDMLSTAPEGLRRELEDLIPVWQGYADSLTSAQDRSAPAADVFGSLSSCVSRLGDAAGAGAEQWLEWGAGLLGSVAAAIPAIASLTAAKKAEANASAEAAVSGAAASVASIPIVGWIMAVSAIAAVIAALTAIPKFAEGGIAYGPTLGVFGEYAGASGNPEVVAPLDRLRSMLRTPDGTGGSVEFRIKGRTLVGILDRENGIRRRG